MLQSKRPDSTTTPPSDVPCPPRNFVAECTTMSAPCSIGRHRYGGGRRGVDDERDAVRVGDVGQAGEVGDEPDGLAITSV